MIQRTSSQSSQRLRSTSRSTGQRLAWAAVPVARWSVLCHAKARQAMVAGQRGSAAALMRI